MSNEISVDPDRTPRSYGVQILTFSERATDIKREKMYLSTCVLSENSDQPAR